MASPSAQVIRLSNCSSDIRSAPSHGLFSVRSSSNNLVVYRVYISTKTVFMTTNLALALGMLACKVIDCQDTH